MPRHRLFLGAVLSTTAVMLVGMAALAAAQDPFDAATNAPAGQSSPAAGGKPAEKGKSAAKKPAAKPAAKKPEPEFVRKSLLEWQRSLPHGVFQVTRLKATEPPFTGRYAVGHFEGTFICACCDAELFSSKTKFDSGTGWPSFWQPVRARAIDRAIDESEAEPRIEVTCHRCGAHLGHVFDDAIGTPTGLRFCINSLSLKLRADEPVTTRPSAKAKVKTTRSRTKAKARTSRAPTTTANEAGPAGSDDGTPDQPEKPATGRADGSGR